MHIPMKEKKSTLNCSAFKSEYNSATDSPTAFILSFITQHSPDNKWLFILLLLLDGQHKIFLVSNGLFFKPVAYLFKTCCLEAVCVE